MELLRATVHLYVDALQATARSLVHGWMMAIGVVIFAVLMLIAATIAAPLGIVGGFILGAVNALLIGATLSLVEQAVMQSRRLVFQDITSSFGQYFWDVINLGFVLWLPLLVLQMGSAANPYGPFLVAAVFLLIFILLNPAPEVIYQIRPGSPLEVIRTSYEFVLDNWIEWFLPLAIVVAPLGLSFFFRISSRAGGGVALDFFQMLMLPFTLLTAWLGYLGLPDAASSGVVLVLTPLAAVAMMIFRGHLFAALKNSTRRKRLYEARF